MMPTLYLVPTPLGDPDDITLRALRILREVRAIATDSPMDTQALLDRCGIHTPIITYGDALAALHDGDVALVTASGTPGIGDAAQEIVSAAIARGIRVEPLPGASTEITALVLSGLPTDAFVCVSALPDDLNSLALERETMIFVTSSVTIALNRLLGSLGDRRVCVAAALTQPNGIVFRGTTNEALAYFDAQPAPGSVVLVVAGAPPQVEAAWDETRVRAELRARLAAGEPLKLAAKAVAAAAGWDRRAVYALGVDEKRNPP